MAQTQRKPAGTWTYEDLFSLPDDGKRYEIIEGELYEMPSLSGAHAKTIINLIALLLPIVARLRAELFTAPLDVFVSGGDIVQPDLVVLLPGGTAHLALRGVEGPPDLAIEVLSPSNRGHDLLTKRILYQRAGVREYWIVDPASRQIELLALDEDVFRTAQIAAGDESIVSPVLGGAAFPLATVFARVRDFADE